MHYLRPKLNIVASGKKSSVSILVFVWVLFITLQGYSASVLAATPPDRAIIRGIVADQRDSVAVANVHIINLSRSWGTTSSPTGSFSMMASAGDKILFQAIGFYKDTILITEHMLLQGENIDVWLSEQIYELPTVDIYPYATFTDFKYAFLNFKDPEPAIDLHLPDPASIPRNGAEGGITLNGPITYLYDRFSRRGKEMARYHELVGQAEMDRRAERVINVELVKRYTGIEDDREVYDFLEYCNLTSEFILAHKEYEVYSALLACFDQYCRERE